MYGSLLPALIGKETCVVFVMQKEAQLKLKNEQDAKLKKFIEKQSVKVTSTSDQGMCYYLRVLELKIRKYPETLA